MASNWISDPQWDGQGKPYVTMLMDGPGYKKGDRRYIAPAEVHPSNSYGQDPKLLAWAQGNQAPGQSLLHERGQWNPRTGKWDQGINYTNLASIGVGGLIAAPFVVPALAGLGGGGAGAGGDFRLGSRLALPGADQCQTAYAPDLVRRPDADPGCDAARRFDAVGAISAFGV